MGKKNAGKTLQEYYESCQFEKGVNSFTDFMQSQMDKRNMFVMSSGGGSVTQDSQFDFYNQGKEAWKNSHDLQDDYEDSFRVQLEQSDLLQGFQVSASITTGYGSLMNTIVTEFVKD